MVGGVALGEGDGGAFVGSLAGGGVDGDLGEEGDFEAFGFALAAAGSEEWVAGAVVTLEPGHILDDSEDRDVDFGKHGDGFAGVDEGDLLWSGDDDGTGEGDALHDGELDVAGAGWQVEDEDVEFAPSNLLKELLGVSVG